MSKLYDYVVTMAIRGACTCGKCCDAPENPGEKQPDGHTVDLTFFKVAAKPEADAQTLLRLVGEEFPQYLDGNEHGYMQIGGDMGDQGIALMMIGLGHVLGCWKAMCPETVMPFMPADMKMKMAGMGMVSLAKTAAAEMKEAEAWLNCGGRRV